jgi:cysteine desulfurase
MARISALVGPTRHTLVVDAVQALGKLDLDFAASAPDMLAISGHKIGAPAGVGALLLKSHADGVRLIPGGGQEQGRRGGTEATALIAAFGAAAAATQYDRQAGNVVNFAVPGLSNATAMMALDLMGLSVSSGSACSSGKVGPSHVLSGMGVPRALAECALRVSFGWSSTIEDGEERRPSRWSICSRRP